MLGLRVTVPVACFRKGLAREYLETEVLPPPATCYGFLLSLVGETDRNRHVGVRVTSGLFQRSAGCIVLRTIWRIKNIGSKQWPIWQGQNPPPDYPKAIKGKGGNLTPDYQQLLTHVEAVIWLDASDDASRPNLEQRICVALDEPGKINRFGALSLGESTHMVDEVCRIAHDEGKTAEIFLVRERGRLTLPVWVDHVGSKDTRYATGDLCSRPLVQPEACEMPMVLPPN